MPAIPTQSNIHLSELSNRLYNGVPSINQAIAYTRYKVCILTVKYLRKAILSKNSYLKEQHTIPARNMRWFHTLPAVLSHTLWGWIVIVYLLRIHPCYYPKTIIRYVRNRRLSVL